MGPGMDEKLKAARLVYYQDDVEQIDKIIDEFIEKSSSNCVLLIDKDGHMVTKRGKETDFDPETLSALVAGSFAATREMARMLGQSEFSVMFHKGEKDHINLSLVGNRAILATVFDNQTTIGMVQLYNKEASEKIEKVFAIASKKPRPNVDIHDNFGTDATKKMNELFGD